MTTREGIRRLREQGRDGRAYRVQLHARPILEAAQSDGGIPVLIIVEGKGASGYYPAACIKSAAPFFAGGISAFIDHPGLAEANLPERSVRDLAGYYGPATIGKFTDPATPLLGPRTAMFSTFYPREGDSEISSLLATTFAKAKRFPNAAPFIGLSILGLGVGSPGASPDDGSPVDLIESLTRIDSVDVVTQAGRCGRVIFPGTGVQESGFRPNFLRGDPAPHVATREAHSASRSTGGFTPHFLR